MIRLSYIFIQKHKFHFYTKTYIILLSQIVLHLPTSLSPSLLNIFYFNKLIYQLETYNLEVYKLPVNLSTSFIKENINKHKTQNI